MKIKSVLYQQEIYLIVRKNQLVIHLKLLHILAIQYICCGSKRLTTGRD